MCTITTFLAGHVELKVALLCACWKDLQDLQERGEAEYICLLGSMHYSTMHLATLYWQQALLHLLAGLLQVNCRHTMQTSAEHTIRWMRHWV